MDKEQHSQDSLATVAVKEYAPSESAFSCEPPPAYQRPMKSTAVQVARIVAVTLVLMSIILGSFIFAAAWVQSSRACELLREEVARQQQHEDHASYQALVADPLQSEESADSDKHAAADSQQQQQQQEAEEEEQQEEEDHNQQQNQVHFKLPLTLDFDDLAGSLVERNLRARMDCVVEKRRLDQTMAQPARNLQLPFGLNVSTAPRLEHATGERLAISCESGRDQRHMPAGMGMMTPVIVPLPGPVHLPLNFQGPMQQPQNRMRPQHEIPIQILEAHQLPVHFAEAQAHRVPVHITEVKQIPIPIPQAHRMPVQMPEVHRMPIPVPEGRHIPMQMPEGQPIALQMMEAHQIPMPMAEGRSMPIQMEAHHIPIQQVAEEMEGQSEQEQQPLTLEALRTPFQRLVPPPPQQAVPRPHYVHPRSVRSVEEVFHKRDKRMRRCACDCAC